MYQRVNKGTEKKYADVINVNICSRARIDSAVKRLFELSRREAKKHGIQTVLEGDQPKFKALFGIYDEGPEYKIGDVSSCLIPSPCFSIAII